MNDPANDLLKGDGVQVIRRLIEDVDQLKALALGTGSNNDLISFMLQLQGIRSLWPGIMDENGAALDIVRGMTLTNNGPAVIDTPYAMPMFKFTGAEYLTRPDEAALQISGTETYIPTANRGFTTGFWYIPGNVAANQYLINKSNATAATTSFIVYQSNAGGGRLIFFVSNGVSMITITNTLVFPVIGQPLFVVARFIPGTRISLFINNQESYLGVGIPASILPAAFPFQVSGWGGLGSPFIGHIGNVFTCASALSDAVIGQLWSLTRPMFGI